MTSCLVVLALCCRCGAAEPIEASFCDMWPLAAGNKWIIQPFQADSGLSIEVVSQETYNGYTAWRMLLVGNGFVGEYVSVYWVFANGWLYQTTDEADLAVLPKIAAGMHRVFPDTFRDGETFTMEVLVATVGPWNLTPVVSNDGVLFYSTGQPAVFPLTRGIGPGVYDPPLSVATIVGTCSVVYPTQISTATAPWVEVGHALRLAVPESGLGFQWYKDGAAIEDASSSTYLKDPAELEDSGSYTCRIWDVAKAFHDTGAVVVKVFPEGSLPVAGTAGLAALVLALTAMSYARIRKS